MLSPESIRIFGSGAAWVAPDGTTMPASLNASLNAAFVDLGYLTEDGVTFRDDKDIGDVRPWQSAYPVKRFINSRSGMLSFQMMEWEREQIMLAFGGGTITEPVANHFRYSPPAAEFLDYRAVVIDLLDDEGYEWRIGIPRALVTSGVEANFQRTGPALLPIELSVVASGSVAPWFIDTDSPTFDTGYS